MIGHGTFPNRPIANWIMPMAIALSETRDNWEYVRTVHCGHFSNHSLPLGSVQRIINSMLPTSDVECTNTKNEKSEMNNRKLWQFPSQKPLTACAFSKKSGTENWMEVCEWSFSVSDIYSVELTLWNAFAIWELCFSIFDIKTLAASLARWEIGKAIGSANRWEFIFVTFAHCTAWQIHRGQMPVWTKIRKKKIRHRKGEPDNSAITYASVLCILVLISFRPTKLSNEHPTNMRIAIPGRE